MPAKYISEVSLSSPIAKNSYLHDLSVVRYLSEHSISFEKPITILVGENGTGKSTLLEGIAIAYGFNPEGGTKNFMFSTNDTHSALCDHLRLTRRAYAKDGFFLRAESVYNAASYIEEVSRIPGLSPLYGAYGGKSLHHQSHGESFLAIVQNRFGGNGLYILDEPEAALSPMRIMTLMIEIERLVKKNSQFIIATHSPMVMALPDAQVLELSENGIEAVDYRDTEHYRVTKGFLNNPERMLDIMMGK